MGAVLLALMALGNGGAVVESPSAFPPAEALPYVSADPTAHVFLTGYQDGGEPYPEWRIVAMVECESKWKVDPEGMFLGLAQFEEGTWATVAAITGLSDPLDPYHQGYNVAVWAAMVSPGTTAGWPCCWWAY